MGEWFPALGLDLRPLTFSLSFILLN
jgi:hypothetical protein